MSVLLTWSRSSGVRVRRLEAEGAVIGSRCSAVKKGRGEMSQGEAFPPFCPCALSGSSYDPPRFHIRKKRQGEEKRENQGGGMLNHLQAEKRRLCVRADLSLSHTHIHNSDEQHNPSPKAATHLCRDRVAKCLSVYYNFNYGRELQCSWEQRSLFSAIKINTFTIPQIMRYF